MRLFSIAVFAITLSGSVDAAPVLIHAATKNSMSQGSGAVVRIRRKPYLLTATHVIENQLAVASAAMKTI